ncbi:ChaN family lipoprotein [Pedobacter punctiformis]|uniref:ChaN family lipoprotein n=1 Tax=Pedobacter punctiformis TaxID=3004097 RepID=A0ABT4LCU6_9SPHI|nr:ChaN family lipoprotein [Pedobacter sp. HCMS5-2]MCZ4245735.1 ChaN family lipoprotein [Pedobacter sp. HCMS5-2]
MKFLLLIISFIVPVGLYAQDISVHYKIYDVKKHQIITLENIVSDMAKADVLFFGEDHNDSIGHYLEAELFKKLNEKYPKQTALTMEMFHTDVQPVINEYIAGSISEKNFIKESRAWGNYKDYKPMIEYAKQNNLTVIGANAATRYSNAVTKDGLSALKSLPKTSVQFLPPLPIDTAEGRYNEKFIETLGGHSMGTMKIYQTQNLWDATMAWSIAKFLKENKGFKVLQLNGRFHSDEKLGTAAKLQKYAPKLRTLNISSFSDAGFDHPDWNKFSNLGDYIILTDPGVKRSF